MTADATRAADLLTRRFLTDYPMEAARNIERLTVEEVAEAMSRQTAVALVPVWLNLLPEVAARLLGALPEGLADKLLAELPPGYAVRLLGFLPDVERELRFGRLDPAIREELRALTSYPIGTAGRLMNPGVSAYRRQLTVDELLTRLGETGMLTARSLFLVDDEGRLTGKAPLQDVALAPRDTALADLELPVSAAVRPLDTSEEVTRAFEEYRVLDLPVVDHEGVFLGAIMHDDLARTAQEQATTDIQTIVGAGPEERALSSPLFTVRRRLP